MCRNEREWNRRNCLVEELFCFPIAAPSDCEFVHKKKPNKVNLNRNRKPLESSMGVQIGDGICGAKDSCFDSSVWCWRNNPMGGYFCWSNIQLDYCLKFQWIYVNKQTRKQRKNKSMNSTNHVFSGGCWVESSVSRWSFPHLHSCDYTIISERVVVISFRVWHNDEWKKV